MKRILIAGAGSYLGESLAAYLAQWPEDYAVETISLRGDAWRDHSFSEYDVIYHVAGIAHQRETAENAQTYYAINRDLPLAVAKKAKDAGVQQFIFLSSMSVYGMDTGVITRATRPTPKSNYGKSKLEAETALRALEEKQFQVAILRPPMVYGKGCRGNFQMIIKLVRKFPVFPRISNERSMIYVENLNEFVRLTMAEGLSGLYFPQDCTYMQTSHMAAVLAQTMEKRLYLSRFLGALLVLVRPFSRLVQKAFGTLVYRDMESLNFRYCVSEQDASVQKSV